MATAAQTSIPVLRKRLELSNVFSVADFIQQFGKSPLAALNELVDSKTHPVTWECSENTANDPHTATLYFSGTKHSATASRKRDAQQMATLSLLLSLHVENRKASTSEQSSESISSEGNSSDTFGMIPSRQESSVTAVNTPGAKLRYTKSPLSVLHQLCSNKSESITSFNPSPGVIQFRCEITARGNTLFAVAASKKAARQAAAAVVLKEVFNIDVRLDDDSEPTHDSESGPAGSVADERGREIIRCATERSEQVLSCLTGSLPKNVRHYHAAVVKRTAGPLGEEYSGKLLMAESVLSLTSTNTVG